MDYFPKKQLRPGLHNEVLSVTVMLEVSYYVDLLQHKDC